MKTSSYCPTKTWWCPLVDSLYTPWACTLQMSQGWLWRLMESLWWLVSNSSIAGRMLKKTFFCKTSLACAHNFKKGEKSVAWLLYQEMRLSRQNTWLNCMFSLKVKLTFSMMAVSFLLQVSSVMSVCLKTWKILFPESFIVQTATATADSNDEETC